MENKKKQLISALCAVGEVLIQFGNNSEYESFSKLVDKDYYEKMNATIQREKNYNGWFTPEAIRTALLGVAKWLTEEKLSHWLADYSFATKPKKVGVIMAGNIPFVGFHDFLAIVLSGHKAMLKPSSDDQRLWPLFMELCTVFYPDFHNHAQLVAQLKEVDAVIATGSDNSARYFEKYFGHLPHIIRKNRTSLAVITGEETDEELAALGADIFTYFGLGCRNVSQLLVQKDFDLDRFFGAILPFSDVINHNKYANNYDYYKAINLMNQVPMIENGFLLTKESDDLFAPTALLNIAYYDSVDEVKDYISKNKERIQVVVGKSYTPFGKAQSPELTDYADGVNTLEFLQNV